MYGTKDNVFTVVEHMADRLTSVVRHYQPLRRAAVAGMFSLSLLIPALSLSAAVPAWAESAEARAIERGEYIYRLAGCQSCHSDSASAELGPAGGVAMDTPFGTFHTPNITPDDETGIGGWSDQQFLDAMRMGISPDGEDYFPAFPYPSYSRMSDRDLLDLKAYLDSLDPVNRVSEAHDLTFPFDQRWLLKFWKLLFFEQRPFQAIPDRTERWNRGAYIVNGPGHCGECHTPRNFFGGLQRGELLAGNPQGPDGESVPSINPEKSASFSQWSEDEIAFALQTGMLPDGDFLGGSMGHVVENSTSGMSESDLKAVAAYLRSPAMDERGGLFYEMFTATEAAAEEEGMMGQGYGMMLGGVFMWLFWLLLIGGAAWLISMLFRSNRPTSPGETALDRLKMRYAKGEIDRIEFEQKKKGLE